MMHLRKFFGPQQIGHGDAAEFAHPTEIVALEIRDHDELRDFLRIRNQFIRQAAVALGIAVAWAGAFDRLRENFASVDPQEQFR
jgi:hypothetical protein